jgi:L-ornithine Nalpha-acyltransferase
MMTGSWLGLTQPASFRAAPFPGARFLKKPSHRIELPTVLGRLGSLEVRLARGPLDLWRAQRLRFKVFYQEKAAKPDFAQMMLRRDADRFDRICDHLLVIDHAAVGPFGQTKPKVVGTYRLLRQDVAQKHGGFYTQGEFDIAPLLAAHRGLNFLELGRSCVLAPYRNKKTVELLWHGIWAYVRAHSIDVMIGCASFEGVSPDENALALSFLHHHARAVDPWQARAHARHDVSMARIPAEMVDARLAVRALPPLIKGYLKLGARFGDGAVIDRQFGTTDVLVVLPVADIDPRYIEYYGGERVRYAA